MGLPGIGPGSLLLILVIVLLVFGTKKLRNAGGDVGAAIKNFKESMNEGDAATNKQDAGNQSGQTIEPDADDIVGEAKKPESDTPKN